jgi:hypothetical protein
VAAWPQSEASLGLWMSGCRPPSEQKRTSSHSRHRPEGEADAEASAPCSKGIRDKSMRRHVLPDWVKRNAERDPGFAVMLFEKESRRAERKYGAHSPQALKLRQQYAVALHQDGQNEKAEAELAAVIARRGLELDAGNEFTQSARFWHARVLYALGRFDDAEHEWREVAGECDRLLGADHQDAIDAHENHAVTLARLDRVAEAEAEMAGVVQKKTAASGTDDAATLGSRTSQAVYLDILGRRPESEAAWRSLADAKSRGARSRSC